MLYGFYGFDKMKEYLGLDTEEELDYEIALIDIDDIRSFDGFLMRDADINYFVTSFDLYSLKKGLEILSGITENLYLKKILFSNTNSKNEDDYLNYLSRSYYINWNEEKIYFPLEMGDQNTIIESQMVAKIKFRGLSTQYKDSLLYITEEIIPETDYSEIKRAIKSIDKI